MIERLARKGFRAVTYADEAYPGRLRLAPDPPPALYVGGGELYEGTSVALVGSRRATRSGIETAGILGRALVASGVRVVSGLAAGVDAAAHEGALAAGGRTVGCSGAGSRLRTRESTNRCSVRFRALTTDGDLELRLA